MTNTTKKNPVAGAVRLAVVGSIYFATHESVRCRPVLALACTVLEWTSQAIGSVRLSITDRCPLPSHVIHPFQEYTESHQDDSPVCSKRRYVKLYLDRECMYAPPFTLFDRGQMVFKFYLCSNK